MWDKLSQFLTGKPANEAEWQANFGGPGRDTAEWAAMMASCMVLRLLAIRGHRLIPGKVTTLTQNIDFNLSKNAKDDPIMAPLAGRRFQVKITATVEALD